MLLIVNKSSLLPRRLIRVLAVMALMLAGAAAYSVRAQQPAGAGQGPTSAPAPNAGGQSGAGTPVGVNAAPASPRRPMVVLDPAHGGTDPGARGTAGIHESEEVLLFTQELRRALEAQGFDVVQTRQGDTNPSLDDRSAMANAQHGAIFVTLHISSTGLPGTARVYVNSDLPGAPDASGLISWDRAQAPFLSLSHKLGDAVQAQLTQRFKGSPATAQTAAVRQLRTTAAPAIAVEISSVSVEDRADLARMAPGVGDAIARGLAAFRPSYVVPEGQR